MQSKHGAANAAPRAASTAGRSARSVVAGSIRQLLCVVACVLGVASVALAGPRGPAFGSNRYQTEIRSVQGTPDTDDYTSALLQGERLSVTVSVGRKSQLRPTVRILRPDGSDVGVDARVRKRGRLLAIRGFVVDESGPWTVRVGGDAGTEGTYVVAFKVATTKPLKVRNQRLGGASPLERTHAFPGVEGGLLDLTVRWKRSGSAVEVRAIDDPAGDPVPGSGSGPGAGATGPLVDEVASRRTKSQVKKAPLATGDGDYSVTVGVDEGQARYALTARVRAGQRPRGRKVVVLSGDEPFLAVRSRPVRGVVDAAYPVRFAGGGFSSDPVPVVLFDGVPGLVSSVERGGAEVVVIPPRAPEGSTVEVAIVNPDGQAAVADDYFHYARPPQISGLVRPDGSVAIGGDTRGGQTFRVQGAFLDPEQTVLFGNTPASVPISAGTDDTLSVVSPAGAPGDVRITVLDPYGRSAESAFTFEYKPAPRIDAAPFTPPFAPEQGAAVVTLSGSGFLDSDVLLVDGSETARELLDGGTLRFTFPASPLGEYGVALRDRVGSVVPAPVFAVKDRPRVDSVSVVGGQFAGSDQVPLRGGALLEVRGSSFHALDTVTLGGAVVTVTERSFTSFRCVSPAGAAGLLDIEVRDAATQSASLASVVRRVGFDDVTSARVPTGSVVDDLSAWRGALGDLDRDGSVDDLVIASYDYRRDNVYRGNRVPARGVRNAPGSRTTYSRLLVGDAGGTLRDETTTRLPSPAGENLNAMAVALGDLDTSAGDEIVLAGVSPDYTTTHDVRILANDGSGGFTLETERALPPDYFAAVYAYDETGQAHTVFSPVYPQGLPTSLALGDIDRDGDLDIVVGRDAYGQTYAYVDPAYVDFTQQPVYVYSGDANTYFSYTFYYYSATSVLLNPGTGTAGWLDATLTRMPSAGDSNIPIVPAFHARDIALGDIDGDTYPDLVVSWDDPLTVSPYGLYSRGSDPARVATRVLVNDRTGSFVDRTSTWLPASSAPEFWQADRVALADLDADGDRDLVLLLATAVDAYLGPPAAARSALRILRNDGTAFVDVTATAVPALPAGTDENWRGGALAIRDVDGDGRLDLLIATRTAARTTSGQTLGATRLLLGASGLTFRPSDAFLPAATVDSGEADDLLLGDLSGANSPPTLLRLSETTPAASPRGDALRAADWER